MNQPHTHPLVGRERDLAQLEQLRVQAARGDGSVLLLSGDGGIGKTRLVSELARTARDGGWHVMIGRAYALETMIPYAPFADACEPVLSRMDGNLLLRLTRGDRAVMTALAPGLAAPGTSDTRASGTTAAELHVRLHAGILQLFTRLAERQPLLLVLENLHWADDSSVELFHFLARQVARHRILLVGTWNETERELPDAVRTMVRSLRAMGAARDIRLEPLTIDAVGQLVALRFHVDVQSVQGFVSALHDATRGNPFFVEQVLEDLVDRGIVRKTGGVWVGWPVDRLTLPRSVRDVMQARLGRLSPGARNVADLIAVVGTSVVHEVLQRAIEGDTQSATDELTLMSATDELRTQGVVVEQLAHGAITYDIAHPMLRQSLIEAVGLARERALHARIAQAIEVAHGPQADRHAEQIAAHWRLADPAINPRGAVHWLLLAGRQAMERLARREAASALRAALDRADAFPAAVDPAVVPLLLDELARLYRRLGEYQHAIAMCTRARDLAANRRDEIGIAVAERRLGLANEGLGRRREAIGHFDAGVAHARAAGDRMLQARMLLAKGDSLQALGQPADARREIAQALELAEQCGDIELLARTHRSLLKLHTWSGPAHRAWAHARSAVELAERSGARNLAWSAHWTAAVLGGFTANLTALQHHLACATRLADELNSPLLQLRTLEIAIEFYSGTGAWDRALIEGERALTTARALDQTTMLARLLYWVGSVYLYRGEIDEARRLFDEAWEVSGAAAVDIDRPFEVHGVLPAFSARIMCHSALGDHAGAIALGRDALAVADRTGYVAWAVYRLIPAIAESASALDDIMTLEAMRARLARDAERLAHTVGRGWVAVIDGELARRQEQPDAAIAAWQQAIATLESVPFPFDAARTRLRLARLLYQQGDVEEATREARAALQVFDELSARPMADEARALLRLMGARMPSRRSAPGLDGLTGRELEIVRLVARRLSNKEIGAQLDISARTVGTHLANVFDKVNLRDRTALGDLAREHGMHRAGG